MGSNNEIMAKNLTESEKENIKRVFHSGCGINETAKRCSVHNNTVRSIVGKNIRSLKDSIKLGFKNHPKRLTENGRKSLSDHAKKRCQKSGKIWTKPEKLFKDILNTCGLGVKFSNDIKDIFNLKDDENATICFQYPLQRYVCDFVDNANKIIYCVNGDFWHANPLLYDENNLTKIQKHNVHHDKQRKIFLEKIGYKVCIIWESEIYWNIDLVKEKIRAVSSEAAASGLHPEGRDFEILTAQLDWSEDLKKLWFKKVKDKKIITKKCNFCGNEFTVSELNKKATLRKFCSIKCSNSNTRKVKNRPSKERLIEELKQSNYLALGRKYGVSDNAIRKWLK